MSGQNEEIKAARLLNEQVLLEFECPHCGVIESIKITKDVTFIYRTCQKCHAVYNYL